MSGLCVQVEYGQEVKAYLDANGLKPSDLVKPKVRKKDAKKQQVAGTAGALQRQHTSTDGRQSTAVYQYGQPWPVITPASAETQQQAALRPAASDDLLVYHLRADGTPECYVQRGDGGMKAAAAGSSSDGGAGQTGPVERQLLLSTLAEQTHRVNELRLQLLNARARMVELEHQNQQLRQLLQDAQLTA